MGRKSRVKGQTGLYEAKAILETLGFKVEIVHSIGREDKEGGDLWVNGVYMQVKYKASVPKFLYDVTEKCPVALVRRIGMKDRGLPWIKIERIAPPAGGDDQDLEA